MGNLTVTIELEVKGGSKLTREQREEMKTLISNYEYWIPKLPEDVTTHVKSIAIKE